MAGSNHRMAGSNHRIAGSNHRIGDVNPRHELDLVLVGATGFTGGLTAEYLAAHAPPDLRWGIGGRHAGRLTAVRERLALIDERHHDLPLLHIDLDDAGPVRELVTRTSMVASTAGPFVEHGGLLVGACADAGTDYLDISGEPEFVDRVYLDHGERARETGARLVHCCGFDSIPHDLGVLFTVLRLPVHVPISIDGYVFAHAGLSAGTYHSAIRAFGRARQMRAVNIERRRVEKARGDRPSGGRRVRGGDSRPRKVPSSNRWAVPLPTIDPVVVRRSARAIARYGPDFRYGHFAVVGPLPMVGVTAFGASGLFMAAQIPPVRQFLLNRKRAGGGPTPEQRARSWFKVRFVATTPDATVVTEVAGGDPGYDETAKMLAETAMCLMYDEVPSSRGQVTTAQALGEPLIRRLQTAGISFTVVAEG
jgi:short subunit dehydrogenase-like uncharacterized protein